MSDSNKIPVTIYEIEREQFEKLNADDTVGEMVRRLTANGTKLTEIILKKQDLGEFTVNLYTMSKFYPPKWLNFLSPVIDKSDPILNSRNKIFSFIGFLAYKTRIYAIAGGYGSFEIEQFTKPEFGLEIIVKLFDRDSRVIKSIQQRGVTGIVLGSTRYYRGDQRFSDENQFGQIFKQVQAELDKHHLIHSFGFSKEDLTRDKAGCLAKSSFKINKAIDFDNLLQLIKRIDIILLKNEKFTLNKVIHLKGKRFEKLVEELNEEMYNQIYKEYKAGQVPDFEICHSQFEQYLTADKYIIELGGKEIIKEPDRPTWLRIIKELKDKASLFENDVFEFKQSVLLRKLVTYDSLDNRITVDTIFDQLNGELLYQGNSFFHIDKGWYRIDASFIDDLNEQCSSLLKEAWDDKLIDHNFDIVKDENIFNQSYINKPGVLVLDTVTPENIECCDILFHDPNDIIFIHVKKGFNNTIRDLASQISIAAKRIKETIHSDLGYLQQVEILAKTPVKKDMLRNAIAGQKFPPKGLVELFKQNPRPKITFCLAFVDTAKSKRSLLTEITRFSSNIAKYSLIELSQDLRLIGYNFKVVQIARK